MDLESSKSESTIRKWPWKMTRIPCELPRRTNGYANNEVARRLKPVVMAIGTTKLLTGFILTMFLLIFFAHFEKLYSLENPRYLSFACLLALVGMVFIGIALLASVLLNDRLLLWIYVLTSTTMSIYIFMLSAFMIHFSLGQIIVEATLPSTTTFKNFVDEFLPPCQSLEVVNNFPISNGCMLGVLVLLGAVANFAGTIAGYTYFNFKYVQPVMY